MAKLLDARIDALPLTVQQTRRFPFGRYRGLDYGMVLHPNGAADVFLEGTLVRHGELSREHRGPRAVFNAVERLLAGSAGQLDATRQEQEISEGQLRDHQARLGAAFPHDAYLDELAELRDRLKSGLSQAVPQPGSEGPSVAKLAEQIRQLKASHSVEAAPVRTTARRMTGEEPVTSRIRRKRIMPTAVTEQQEAPAPAEEPAAAVAAEAGPAEIHPFPTPTPVTPARPQPDHRHQVASRRRQDGRQLSLF